MTISPSMGPIPRRSILGGAALLGLLVACGSSPDIRYSNESTKSPFEVSHTDAEWRRILTADQYDVLRKAGTERPFTSPLNDEHRTGIFTCAGCALDLFSSSTKFDSGTGWPSFWQPLDNAVIERPDNSFFMTRTEVLCRRCGGHLGHVFTDGPQPTGLRYCMNGVALNFRTT
ncbi:MAG: peptide-methionine (R)-S-oxide reductase MsrB [Nocardiaceae bacterium]|nr:peptide-methionine (R)-S-oxide reductase MsrB [Nocardiaceae bacterium]